MSAINNISFVSAIHNILSISQKGKARQFWKTSQTLPCFRNVLKDPAAAFSEIGKQFLATLLNMFKYYCKCDYCGVSNSSSVRRPTSLNGM